MNYLHYLLEKILSFCGSELLKENVSVQQKKIKLIILAIIDSPKAK